jgi:hypothetical protein
MAIVRLGYVVSLRIGLTPNERIQNYSETSALWNNFLLGQDLCEVVKANILLMNNSVCVTNEGDVTELNRTEQTRKHKFTLIKQ